LDGNSGLRIALIIASHPAQIVRWPAASGPPYIPPTEYN
jgi:hypothetical protein